MSFDTVDLLTGKVFQVTWDLGRRCNYDCSYCPAHRHDNWSPHASLDELKKSVDFLFEYLDTYMQHRSFKEANISFTGGEPTVNPNFIKFVQYLKQQYDLKYKDKWNCVFSLTSNGAMSSKMAQSIIDNLFWITVSYHAESSNKLKQQVKDRIQQFHEANFGVNCNVMFHAQYFDECKEFCSWLDSIGVQYTPRIIGEEPDSKSNFAHRYTDEQLDYMKNYWKYKNAELNETQEEAAQLSNANEKTSEKKKLGMTIGRPCCGSREMCLSLKGKGRKSTFVDMREFKGWHCSVNWFFLHIEQQTDSVFHHQTCQARFNGTRGPIGKLSEGYKIIQDLKEKIKTQTLPTIICPKQTCGCGLCAPKSKHQEKYIETVSSHYDIGVLDVVK